MVAAQTVSTIPSSSFFFNLSAAATAPVSGGTVTLLATLDGTTAGTPSQFSAVRAWMNANEGKTLRVTAEYPRTFGTVTNGMGYTEVEWTVTRRNHTQLRQRVTRT